MPYAELLGTEIWYTDTGGPGAAVIFLHAASGTSLSWEYQLPAFAAAGYRCICYDRRGWGRSRLNGARQQPTYAADDLEALAGYLGIDRLNLVATAAGGTIALDFGLANPGRVTSAIIADSTCGVQDSGYTQIQRNLRPAAVQSLPIHIRELSAGFRGVNVEGTRRWMDIERLSGFSMPERQLLRNQLSLTLLEHITMPVLLMVGDADLLTPPALMRVLTVHIPGSQLVTIPEAGHAAFWEQPEEWNRHALEFLSRHSPTYQTGMQRTI